MSARSCAKRAHQLAASLVRHGVGPSRLPSPSACGCQSSLVSAPLATRSFGISVSRREEASHPESPGPDAKPHSSSSPSEAQKSVGFFTEDVADAEPTLEYLDSLKPRKQRFQRDHQRHKRNNSNPFAKASTKGSSPEDKQWDRTRTRLNSSFTRDQLAALARSARIPGSYSTKVRKDELIRRIMVHRFGMEDAQERADREKREELEKRSVHISFRPAELYLLLARGSGRVRQEASKAQVAILPTPPAKETEQGASTEKLGFWIRGKDQGIARMTRWVETFKQSISTKEEDVILSAVSSDTLPADSDAAAVGEVLPQELVRFISQQSRCFMEASPVRNGKLKLSLAYLDEQDAEKAVLLLRQYQADTADALQRIGAAAYRDDTDSGRHYGMLPFVPKEPTPWIKQADDLLYGSHSDVLFRVAYVPDLSGLSWHSTAELPTMKLKGWSHEGEGQFAEPFQALLESAAAPLSAGPTSEIEYSAILGHVLFSGGGLTLADEGLSEEQVLSRLSDPLSVPCPGSWPIEHVLDWACDFRKRFGREASRFVPTTLFRPQKNVSLELWLERQGYELAGKGTIAAFAEKMVLVYQPAAEGSGRKLEVVLARERKEADELAGARGGWSVEEARWVQKAEGDMMVPDKTADLRLSAKTIFTLQDEARKEVEDGLASYLNPRSASTRAARALQEEDKEVEVHPAEATTEGHEAKAEPNVGELVGSETELMDHAPTAAVKGATSTKYLPPSKLELSSGLLALQSATRMTVQAYHQRSSPASPLAGSTELEASKPTVDAIEAAAGAPITAAEHATEPGETETPDAASVPSPVLLREMTQDLVTKSTTESLRMTWRLPSSTPTPQAPQWTSLVHLISAFLDRHDISTR